MKTSHIVAAAALAVFAAAGAQAETYEGVQAPVSALSRADVANGGVQASAAPNQNVPAGSRVLPAVAVSKDRGLVQAEAVRANYAPDQNVSGGSRVNSRVISTMQNPVDTRSAATNGGSKL